MAACALVIAVSACARLPATVEERPAAAPPPAGAVVAVAPPPKPAPPPPPKPPAPDAKPAEAAAPSVARATTAAAGAERGRGVVPRTAAPVAVRPPAAASPVRTVALPPVPAAPPADTAELARLLSRPPIAPPVPAALLVPAGQGPADARCTEATRAAREAVLAALSVPRERLTATDWVEPILKITELALVACRGDAAGGIDPASDAAEPVATQAASYWRATAFLLHGQYARAAVHYGRAADMEGAYAWLGYSRTLATVLDRCAKQDRPALEAWRLAGLLEARGETDAARRLYSEAANSACPPLAKIAAVRAS